MTAKQWKQSMTRSQKSPTKSQNSMLEAIAKLEGEKTVSEIDKEGAVRMKLVVRKQDLRKVLEEISGEQSDDKKRSSLHFSNYSDDASFTLEQRLIIMRKRRNRRVYQEKGQGSWRPMLHSIPEEF
uniref:Uncharacterized protein n=1 Tax=Kalanchoe fedtschenkoi TaxID=63787 RepID=A0A7N0U605_KALFE